MSRVERHRRHDPRRPEWPWAVRHGLFLTGLAPIVAQLVGSLFNVWYNHQQIRPLLTADQLSRFMATVVVYNATVYPLATGLWAARVASLRPAHRRGLSDVSPVDGQGAETHRRVINLPWFLAGIAAAAWLMCIPIFLGVLASGGDALHPMVMIHLPVSFAIGGSIAVTHGFFAVEWAAQKWLFPLFFQDGRRPATVSGGMPLSLRGRILVWVLAAVVCPIASLVLLEVTRVGDDSRLGLVAFVAVAGLCFGIVTAALTGRWIAQPVASLRAAAGRVADGDFHTHIDLARADEFGLLIDAFNSMTVGLREKERIRQTFGQHVGQQAVREILSRDPDLIGAEQNVTVAFVDLRDFTSRSERLAAPAVVRLLNTYLSRMVEVIEQHQGMANKFLGDGIMVVFGAAGLPANHEEMAVRAGRAMIAAMDGVNAELGLTEQPLRIGVGIHTGPAIVGSIGSVRRRDYTAIGDTVNVASRVESLTKRLNSPLLFTQATRDGLGDSLPVIACEPQTVRGKAEPLRLYRPA